jgi:hypothetical protein
MPPLRNFIINLDKEQWRFIIAELKQSTAFYSHLAREANEQGARDEADGFRQRAWDCDEVAKGISSQIEGQKEQ